MAHTKDFAEAGDSSLDLLPAILSRRLHPGGDGRRLQGSRGHASLDQIPDRLGHSKNLKDASPSGKSRVPAHGAPDRLVELVDLKVIFGNASLPQQQGLQQRLVRWSLLEGLEESILGGK